jgi:putative ABC transport system substrate-binding protein
MSRRALICALASGLLAAPLAAEAQEAAKVARIGYLAVNLAATPHRPEAFRQALRDLGYVEGRNGVIEYRDAEGKIERLSALAADLVALKVDVIVAAGTPAALAAKQATRTVPIVFAAVFDPVTSGLVTSLALPGGNVTGTSTLAPESVGKCLEYLKQAVPGGQSGRGPLAARCLRRTHGKGHAEGSRSRGAGAGGAASNSSRREVRRTSTGPSRA